MAGGPPTVASAHHSTQRPPMTGAAWTSIYGATPLGGARCCDPTLVSPLSRTGLPQPCVAAHDAALQVAERRKPKAAYGGPQQLVVYIYWGGSVSEPSELRQPCVAPLRRHGPGVGGPCWQCRCRPSRALPSGHGLAGAAPREPTDESRIACTLDLADAAWPPPAVTRPVRMGYWRLRRSVRQGPETYALEYGP